MENQEQIDNQPEEQIVTDPTMVEEPQILPEEPSEENIEEPIGEEAENPEPQPSRRESRRIQNLIEKMKQGQKFEEMPEARGIDYREEFNVDDDTARRLEDDRRSTSEKAYQQGLEQTKSIQFNTRLEIDAPKVISSHPELDPSNDKFDRDLADNLNTWYLTSVGWNPKTGTVARSDIRYTEFVDGIYEMADRMAGRRVEASVKNVARQASQTGIRPDGSPVKRMNLNKPMSQMDDKELAEYGRRIGLEK